MNDSPTFIKVGNSKSCLMLGGTVTLNLINLKSFETCENLDLNSDSELKGLKYM